MCYIILQAILLGASDTFTEDKKMQVTVAFNRFDKGLVQRMPCVRFGFAHVVNNDYNQWEMYAIGGLQGPTILSQGNRFFASNNQNTKEVMYFLQRTISSIVQSSLKQFFCHASKKDLKFIS